MKQKSKVGPSIATKIVEEVTCKGCRFLISDTLPGGTLIENSCQHPTILKGNRLGLTIGFDRNTNTPSWCPELKKGSRP